MLGIAAHYKGALANTNCSTAKSQRLRGPTVFRLGWSFSMGSISRLSNLRSTIVGFRSWQHASKCRQRFSTVCTAAPAATGLSKLEDLVMDNSFVRELPGDDSKENKPRQVYSAFYSLVAPTPTDGEPYTVAYSPLMAAAIGLDPTECERMEFASLFCGQSSLPAARGTTYAQCYGGHQFGHWAGQLGDGRAITLGEAVNPVTGDKWELQLKGAGRTPYSRFADGRAVMRSSVREFLASEAMYHLGVPTTRALSLVGTGAEVMRDMFYNGNARMEAGAVVCRVAKSFVRFGTFQLPAIRGGEQLPLVKTIADYVIKHHYPHLQGSTDEYLKMFQEVCERTGRLVALWHGVGFTHGVLNTDNMSILGDTIDYGPYGFMERFDPNFTPNTTDLQGRRYCFKNQPAIGQWNLSQLASAMCTAQLMTVEQAEGAIDSYSATLADTYHDRMAQKLGLKTYNKDLSIQLLNLAYKDAVDFTNMFRCLSSVSTYTADDVNGLPQCVRDVVEPADSEREDAWKQWVLQYRTLLVEEGMEESERQAMQNAVNPVYIPRNHVMQDVIVAAEQGNFEPLHAYYSALQRPYQQQADAPPKYTEPAPKQCRLGVELLSCSS